MEPKVKRKKQDDTNSRIHSGYDLYIYPQRDNMPLQGLDRRALMVGTSKSLLPNWSPPLVQFAPVMDLHGRQKTLWRSRPVDISQ